MEKQEHREKMRAEVEKARQHLKDLSWTCGICTTSRQLTQINPL
jgi:hypothetical protein